MPRVEPPQAQLGYCSWLGLPRDMPRSGSGSKPSWLPPGEWVLLLCQRLPYEMIPQRSQVFPRWREIPARNRLSSTRTTREDRNLLSSDEVRPIRMARVSLQICRSERESIRRYRRSVDGVSSDRPRPNQSRDGVQRTSVGSLRTTTLATSNSSNSMNAASPSGPKASGIAVASVG